MKKMKKRNFFAGCFTFIMAISINAQIIHQNSLNHLSAKSLTYKKLMDNTNHVNMNMSIKNYGPTNYQSKIYENGIVEEIIGETYYDLQTNNSIQNRLFVHDDNSISAVWTMGPKVNSGFPNRGTGYNYHNGISWLPLPTSRLETYRTGWPSISALNNSEIIASHVIGNDESSIDTKTTIASRLNKGKGSWSENILPNSDRDSTINNMWPRMKVGGPNNKTIHLISHSYNVDSVYNKSVLYYSRSQNAGNTWDITDSILPGIDADNFNSYGLNADAYALDVKGKTVAFVIGNSWSDVVLMKSIDNGSTWTKTVIAKHPIPMFYDDTLVQEPIEWFDENFSITLDASGNAHVFSGVMAYSNILIGDNSYEYYPLTQGLKYWNETTTTWTLIANVIDENNNGTIDINDKNNIADYSNSSLTSFPSSAIAENGDLYLIYSGVIEYFYPEQVELLNSGDDNYLQHYRHLYIMRSTNGGKNWSKAYDLMKEITNPETGDPLQEGVYGCLGNKIDDHIYLTYQRDHQAGISILGDEDPITNNKIVFMKIPVAEFDDLANLSLEKFDGKDDVFSMHPNPANNVLNITLNKNDEETSINIINLLGQNVLSKKTTNLKTQLNIESLRSGIYVVLIENSTKKMVKKLLKE